MGLQTDLWCPSVVSEGDRERRGAKKAMPFMF